MNRIAIAALIVGLLASCTSKVKKENESLKAQTLILKQENESFIAQNKGLTASLDAYKKTLKEVDQNLKNIDANATMVAKIGKDGDGMNDRETVLARVASIKALMDNSKLKILALDKSLYELRKKYGDQSEEVLELNRAIKAQTKLLIEKENEITIMQAELADKEELEEAYELQVNLTNQLKEIVNRAYYFAGTSRELKEKGIVDPEGGFIGIGRVKVINASSPDGLFYQIKKDETGELKFDSKSPQLISSHPAESYELLTNKNATTLLIKDRSLFWKNANYLVVQL